MSALSVESQRDRKAGEHGGLEDGNMKQVSKRNQRMRQSRLGALFISCLPVRKKAAWKNVTFFFTWREGGGKDEERKKRWKERKTKG